VKTKPSRTANQAVAPAPNVQNHTEDASALPDESSSEAEQSHNTSRNQEGDPFIESILKLEEFIRRRLYKLGARKEDVDDLYMKVVKVAWAKGNEYDPGIASKKTWIRGICFKIILSYYRQLGPPPPDNKRSNASNGPEDSGEHLLPVEAPDAALERQEKIAKLLQILSKLSPELRHVWIMFELEGMTLSEISEELRFKKENRARYLLEKSRKKFTQAMYVVDCELNRDPRLMRSWLEEAANKLADFKNKFFRRGL
jgi:RNA polymerase sigma factor (sigma-70 family)